MGQHPGDELAAQQAERAGSGRGVEDATAALPQRHVKVQPAARLVGKRLGHHREDHAARFGQRLRGQLEEHQPVATEQSVAMRKVDFVLAVRVFVVHLLHIQVAGGQRLVQLVQEAQLARQRLQVV